MKGSGTKKSRMKFGERIKAVNQFLFTDIWRMSLSQNPKGKGNFWIHTLRIAMLAIRGFKEDNVAIRASALTFSQL
jgi:hypothetical protein